MTIRVRSNLKAYVGLKIAERERIKFITKKLIVEKGRICALCGKPIQRDDEVSIDHIIPVSKGGATVESNLQLAHKSCNLEKGNKYDNTRRK